MTIGKRSQRMTPLSTPVDGTLQRRNERIFEQEIYPLLDAVYAFAYRLTNDANRAEDLAQETYMKAWRFIGSYQEGTNAKAWMFRICKHVFINEYRSAARQPRKVDYEDIVVYHNEDDVAVPRYMGLREEMGDQLLGDEVITAIGTLQPIYRDVLMFDLEDFSYEEIAKLVDVPIGTVRSRLHRARNLMADKLREYARDNGYGVKDEQHQTATPTGDTPGEVAAPASSCVSISR